MTRAVVRWHYARWRARRAVHWADLDYRRDPTPDHLGRWKRACDQLQRLEWNPPRALAP